MNPRLKTYDYTPEGRLSRRTWARTATYAYDHRGRMLSKEILPTSTNSTFSTLHSTFVWDGWNIIRETTTNLSTFQPFNFSTSYVWGLDIDGTLQGAGGVGGLIAVVRDDGVFHPAYDANGNITEYVSTSGDTVAHYEYSAFGEPVVSSGELASSFTHQFSTKPYSAATSFSEYQMRKYRPEIGRWTSRDTLDAPFSINEVISANNNLIDNLDFLGNLEIIGIGACLLKCGIESAFEELIGDFLAGSVFCGDLKRECEQNFVDYLTDKIPTPFPPPRVLPPPTFGKSKMKRITNCLFECLKLDTVGLSISSDVKLKNSKSNSKTFSCNETSKSVTYSLDISMEMYIEPVHKMIFEKQSSITGSCGRVAFGTCCPCGGK